MKFLYNGTEMEILREEIELKQFESEDHAIWYYKLLISLAKATENYKHKKIKEIDTFMPLKDFVSGVHQLYMGINNLTFLFQKDEMMVKRYFHILENQLGKEKQTIPPITVNEFCLNFSNYAVMQSKRQK